MRIFWRLLWLALAGGLAFWLWTVFFPSEEQQVRKHLAQTAKAASFSGTEGTLSQIGGVTEFIGCFTPDVELDFDLPRQGRVTVQGRDEIMAIAAQVRRYTSALKVEFLDVSVKLAQDHESASAVLTARAEIPTDKDFSVQEMKFTLKRINRRWIINRVETVKTLSFLPRLYPFLRHVA